MDQEYIAIPLREWCLSILNHGMIASCPFPASNSDHLSKASLSTHMKTQWKRFLYQMLQICGTISLVCTTHLLDLWLRHPMDMRGILLLFTKILTTRVYYLTIGTWQPPSILNRLTCLTLNLLWLCTKPAELKLTIPIRGRWTIMAATQLRSIPPWLSPKLVTFNPFRQAQTWISLTRAGRRSIAWVPYPVGLQRSARARNWKGRPHLQRRTQRVLHGKLWIGLERLRRSWPSSVSDRILGVL